MSGSYEIGQAVKLTATFTNTAGAVADPTTVTAKYQDPSGNETTLVYGTDAALVKASTGVYSVTVTVDEAGRWYYRFAGTGAVIAATESEFYVRPSQF